MAPKHTRKSAPTTRGTQTQGTLAFGAQNKITKPSSSHPSISHKPSKPLSKPAVATVIDAVTTPPALPESAENEPLPGPELHPRKALSIRSPLPSQTRDPQEEKASRVTEAQIKRYWKAKEEARIAPRVHQQGLSLHEKILREFDLSSHFGPCIGISRMKRWKRAEGLGLSPPLEVLAVLVREREGGNGEAERAGIEGLLSSRTEG